MPGYSGPNMLPSRPSYSEFGVSGKLELWLKESLPLSDFLFKLEDYLKAVKLENVLTIQLDKQAIYTHDNSTDNNTLSHAISLAQASASSANHFKAVFLVVENDLQLVLTVEYYASHRFHQPVIELIFKGKPIEFIKGEHESEEQFESRMRHWWIDRTPDDGSTSVENVTQSEEAFREKLLSLLQRYSSSATTVFDIQKSGILAEREGTPP